MICIKGDKLISAARGGAILIVAPVIGFILNDASNVALSWLLTPEQFKIYGVSVAAFMTLTIIYQRRSSMSYSEVSRGHWKRC